METQNGSQSSWPLQQTPISQELIRHSHTPFGSNILGCHQVVEQGQREVEAGFMPQIKPLSVSIADYDVIAIGTPTWWYTMAPAVLTFLHQRDFTGKTVIPFMTNGGWPGHVIKDMEAECKGAKFAHEMKIQFDSTGGDRLETPERVITKWVADVKKDLN